MGDVWITDIRHYLGNDLEFISLPGPAMKLRDYLGSIVEAVTSRDPGQVDYVTEVRCRRRPRHRRCEGSIVGYFADNDPSTIEWLCLFCGDRGNIKGWEGTVWDKTENR